MLPPSIFCFLQASTRLQLTLSTPYWNKTQKPGVRYKVVYFIKRSIAWLGAATMYKAFMLSSTPWLRKHKSCPRRILFNVKIKYENFDCFAVLDAYRCQNMSNGNPRKRKKRNWCKCIHFTGGHTRWRYRFSFDIGNCVVHTQVFAYLYSHHQYEKEHKFFLQMPVGAFESKISTGKLVLDQVPRLESMHHQLSSF